MDSCNKGFILPLYVVHTFVFVHPLHKQIATSSLVLTAPSKSNISRSNRFIKKKYDDGPEAHENKTSLPTVNNCKSSASAIALGVKKSSACVSSNSVSNDANLQLLFSSVAPDSIASDSTSTASIPLQIILVMFSLISDYTTLSSTVTDASVNGDPHQAYIRDLFSSIIIENCDNVLSFSKYLKTESNATYDKNESTTPANVADELWINDVQFIGDLLYHCMLLKPIQDRIINYCKEMHVDSKLKRKSKISKSYCDAVDAKEVTLLDINHMVDRNAYYNTKGLKTISISMLYLLQSNNLYNTCQSVAKGLHIFDYSNHHMDASALNIKSKGAMDSKAMEGALSSLSSFVILVSTFSKYRQFALQYHYNEVVYHFLRHKQAFHSKLKELESDLDVHENSMQSVHNTSIGATVETQLEELQSQLMHFEQMKRHCVLQTKILKKEYEISIKKVKGMLTSVLNLHDSICYYNKFKPFIHPSAMTFANQYDDNNSTSEVTETANKVNSSDKVVEASSDSSSLNMIVNGSENDVTSDAHKEINATPTQSVSCLYKMQSNISKQLEEMEDTLMSLLGLPLPVPMIDSQTYPTSNSKINANITLLYRLMMSIEKMLKYTDASNERINRTDGLLSPGKPADGVGATITLKNKSNDTMLQKNDLNKSHTVSTTGNINVIRNVNDLMQLQRIQQITLFLEYNEKKAVKKKKLLVATLELFEAAAKLKNKDSRIRASQHLEMNFNNLFEIEEYANNIKETVLEDMKHDAVIATGKSLDMNVSYTKIQQVLFSYCLL